MLHFDIIRQTKIEQTFRVSKVEADFDVKPEHANEHFVGDIEMPEGWKIGAIVGGSGTGKSTISKELFGKMSMAEKPYAAASVIDDMPDVGVDQITKMFYSVGFGSVPSWLKPYSVLSTGEKMRVDLARALLSDGDVLFDEFTSVVDRTVAQTACIAIKKAMQHVDKRLIVVSCHTDIVEWLQPDWVFDTGKMQSFFAQARAKKKDSMSGVATLESGQSLGAIII